jgi:hypothetical protein
MKQMVRYPMLQSGQEHERKRERYKENSL